MITNNIKKTEREKLMMGGTWPSPSNFFAAKYASLHPWFATFP
jgi:hypothetical protein